VAGAVRLVKHYRSIARNTFWTAGAFLLVGTLGLLVVPFIVRQYGLGVFGLISLARTLLPGGFLGLIDFGVAEATTLFVGRARGGGEWEAASEKVTFLLVVSVVIGIAAALGLYGFRDGLMSLFKVDEAYRAGFGDVLAATATALVVFFPALVLEGIVKGYEKFGVIRLAEVMSAVFYAGGVVVATRAEMAFETIAYLFLASIFLKLAILGGYYAAVIRRNSELRLMRWSRSERADAQTRGLLIVQAKITGTLQTQAPSLLVGGLFGPAALGLYDVVVRIPRFMKVIAGFVNATILPLSAKLESGGEIDDRRRLARMGFVLIPGLGLPVVFWTTVAAPGILAVWLGDEYVPNWPWFALMTALPTAGILLGFNQALLATKNEFVAHTNRLLAGQLGLQIGLSLLLAMEMKEQGFILGQAIAIAVLTPLQYRLSARDSEIALASVLRALWRLALMECVLAGVFLAIVGGPAGMAHQGVVVLVGTALIWCVLSWAGWYVMALTDSDRLEFRQVVRAAGIRVN
jgi:O-antigen/teichoic acid export membrane protein